MGFRIGAHVEIHAGANEVRAGKEGRSARVEWGWLTLWGDVDDFGAVNPRLRSGVAAAAILARTARVREHNPALPPFEPQPPPPCRAPPPRDDESNGRAANARRDQPCKQSPPPHSPDPSQERRRFLT